MTKHDNFRLWGKVTPGQAEDYEIELRDGSTDSWGPNEDADSDFARMQRLWRHALIEKVKAVDGRSKGNAMNTDLEERQMEHWFNYFDRPFQQMKLDCEMAGLDWQAVHKAFKEGRLCADNLISNHRAML